MSSNAGWTTVRIEASLPKLVKKSLKSNPLFANPSQFMNHAIRQELIRLASGVPVNKRILESIKKGCKTTYVAILVGLDKASYQYVGHGKLFESSVQFASYSIRNELALQENLKEVPVA